MLLERGVHITAKPFSVGFRIEHPQGLIDRARFGPCAGHPDLGAADYSLAHHASNGRTAYSFCMCPGGTVVAAASEPGGVVTNGMSQYSRKERNANAGIVVGVTPEADFPAGPLAGVDLQRRLEQAAFAAGGGGYAAPGQRLGDFLQGKPSDHFGEVIPSYRPGVTPTDLSWCLPDYAIAAIREALPAFGRQIPGFDHPDAVLTGVETRTSSPIRIGRGADFQSLNTRGPVSGRRGRGLCGRHPVGGGGRHQGRRGGGAEPDRRAARRRDCTAAFVRRRLGPTSPLGLTLGSKVQLFGRRRRVEELNHQAHQDHQDK